MNLKNKLRIAGFFLLFQNVLFAHNPQQASFQLMVTDELSYLNITLSQYGVEQALVKKYSDLDVKTIAPKDFKELIINYLKQNIHLSVNGKPLKIGSGIIKLGNHQTDLKFKIEDVPKVFNEMEVNIPCFQENENQSNFFTVIYKDRSKRVKLTKKNHFKAEYTFDGENITISKVAKETSSFRAWILVAIGLGVLAVLLFVFKSKK